MPSAAPAILVGRCDPYGAETGGPKRVMGGLYGPASARTPDMGLPANVEQGEWSCPNTGVIRCRMHCRCGHKGQVMTLCSWHDEDSWHAEIVAGASRRVHSTVQRHGHYEEISRRQAEFCPACAWPPPYGDLQKEIQSWQAEMFTLFRARLWDSPRANQLKTFVVDAGLLMDAARQAGIIHQCPLTLVPVS